MFFLVLYHLIFAQNAKGMFTPNKITSQQVNCENDVVGLIGPPTEAKVKVNNKVVNNLLHSGSQVSL